MRLNPLKNVVVAAGSAALIAGCALLVPVHNVESQPVSTSKPSVTLDEVGNAIVRAGATLNFQMQKAGPGVITATYSPRGTSATMEVKYDTRQYSIAYKDSRGLDYDGRQIHRIYNGWVENFDKRIREQLSAL
jgi:hypothetical protein